ncbi:hypothetical protein MKK69_08170 [Methylobacterium sp. J-026]|uniref:hypothetical protein n=1 Tax=Methylobacterium sp. J-026 TaxID=2836624 RepID=UPI001FBABB9C|nr:hypothetical protein [Methylobacterium sp. J-026]MCJ2134041.1 hypothetical protein [Methylobacterium sp. J-026]
MSAPSTSLASPPPLTRLYDLQLEQLTHDESFHKDVVILPLADRIKHMALHNAKYVGYFVDAVDAGDDCRFQAVLTDAFIITLATANTLNQNIGHALEAAGAQVTDLRSLSAALKNGPGRAVDGPFDFVKAYARAAGLLAKACESWDHMEDVPYVAIMRTTNIDLFKLIVAEAALRSLDLEALFRTRLRFIERRSIFHPTLSAGRS